MGTNRESQRRPGLSSYPDRSLRREILTCTCTAPRRGRAYGTPLLLGIQHAGRHRCVGKRSVIRHPPPPMDLVVIKRVSGFRHLFPRFRPIQPERFRPDDFRPRRRQMPWVCSADGIERTVPNVLPWEADWRRSSNGTNLSFTGPGAGDVSVSHRRPAASTGLPRRGSVTKHLQRDPAVGRVSTRSTGLSQTYNGLARIVSTVTTVPPGDPDQRDLQRASRCAVRTPAVMPSQAQWSARCTRVRPTARWWSR